MFQRSTSARSLCVCASNQVIDTDYLHVPWLLFSIQHHCLKGGYGKFHVLRRCVVYGMTGG